MEIQRVKLISSVYFVVAYGQET